MNDDEVCGARIGERRVSFTVRTGERRMSLLSLGFGDADPRRDLRHTSGERRFAYRVLRVGDRERRGNRRLMTGERAGRLLLHRVRDEDRRGERRVTTVELLLALCMLPLIMFRGGEVAVGDALPLRLLLRGGERDVDRLRLRFVLGFDFDLERCGGGKSRGGSSVSGGACSSVLSGIVTSFVAVGEWGSLIVSTLIVAEFVTLDLNAGRRSRSEKTVGFEASEKSRSSPWSDRTGVPVI